LARRRRPGGATSSEKKQQPRPATDRLGALARLRPLVPLLCVLVLVALLHPEAMLQGKVYGSADASSSDAFRQVVISESEKGHVNAWNVFSDDYPQWNPYIFLGMPSFGSVAYTYGVYPPTLLLDEVLQNRLGFFPLTWMIAHLVFGGLGVWWLMGRWDSPWPARLAACVGWLFCARIVAWGVHGHGTKLIAAMYLPWLVGLAWEILVRGRARPVAIAALLLGLQFLRGHPQISYYTLLLLGFLTLWNLFWPLGRGERPDWATRLGRSGLMAVLVIVGLLVGSVLLLPGHDYADISTRGEGGASGGGGTAFEYATQWSLAPEDLAALVVPTASGFGKATYLGRMPFTDYPNYLGPLLLLLAAAAWYTGRRSLVLGLVAASLVALLVGMGRFSPGLYQLFYEALPYFDKFRVPSMIMVLPTLAVAILAGLGLGALADDRQMPTGLLRRGAFLLLGLGGLWLLVAATPLSQGAYQERLAALADQSGKQAAPVILEAATELHRSLLVRQALVLLAAGGAVLLASRRPAFRARWLVPVLALILIIDLGSVARLVTHPERALHEVVRARDGGGRLAPASSVVRSAPEDGHASVDPTLASVLQQEVGHGRLLPVGRDASDNAYMTVGVRSLGGYYPAKPAAAEAVRQRLFAGVPPGTLARWLGAAAITFPGQLGPENLALLEDAGLEVMSPGIAAGPTVVYPLVDPVPRARLVDTWRPVSMLPEGDALEPFLDAVASGRHDPMAVTILGSEPVQAPVEGPEPLPEPEFVLDSLNEIVLAVDAPRPALLLLSGLWASGWSAKVDGEDAPVLRADLMLRAVELPAGAQEVRFEYRDRSLQRGRILTVVGYLAVLVLWIVAGRLDRRVADQSVEG
jgi:hypothetical protein